MVEEMLQIVLTTRTIRKYSSGLAPMILTGTNTVSM